MPRPTGKPEELTGYEFADLKNVGDEVEGRFSFQTSVDPEEGVMYFLTPDDGKKLRLPNYSDLRRKLQLLAAKVTGQKKSYWVHVVLRKIEQEGNKARIFEVSSWEE